MHPVEPTERVTPAAVDHDAVSRLAARVEFEDIRMVWVRVGLNAQPTEIEAEWSDAAYLGYDAHAGNWTDEKNTAFTAEVLFVAGYDRTWAGRDEPPDYDPENPPDVDIAVLFELAYSLSGDEAPVDDDVEHFAVFNSTFNAWPYWRELAQTATQRMRIAPLLVPVLRVPRLTTAEDSSEETAG